MAAPVSWEAFVEAIATGVRCVKDENLLAAARLIAAADFVITAGNGGSSSLASHMAQAIAKPDYAAGGGRRAVCLTDHVPTLTAHANDGGWETALLNSAEPFLRPGCLVIAFSSSGKSPNICRLAAGARAVGLLPPGRDGAAPRLLRAPAGAGSSQAAPCRFNLQRRATDPLFPTQGTVRGEAPFKKLIRFDGQAHSSSAANAGDPRFPSLGNTGLQRHREKPSTVRDQPVAPQWAGSRGLRQTAGPGEQRDR